MVNRWKFCCCCCGLGCIFRWWISRCWWVGWVWGCMRIILIGGVVFVLFVGSSCWWWWLFFIFFWWKMVCVVIFRCWIGGVGILVVIFIFLFSYGVFVSWWRLIIGIRCRLKMVCGLFLMVCIWGWEVMISGFLVCCCSGFWVKCVGSMRFYCVVFNLWGW